MTRKLVPATLAVLTLSFVAGCEQPAPPPPPPAPPPQAAAPTCFEYQVYFATGSVLMNPQDIQTINKVTLEAGAPDARVILVGKTDTVGTKAYNMRLSRRRADNVNKALIDNGVLARKIAWFYTGKERPMVPTGDEESEPRNRTVRIAVGVNCPLPR